MKVNTVWSIQKQADKIRYGELEAAETLAEQINGFCYNGSDHSRVAAWQNVAAILCAEIDRLTETNNTASDTVQEALYG